MYDDVHIHMYVLTYPSLYIITFLFVEVAKAPGIYSLSKFLVFNTALLTAVIMLSIRSLFILHHSNFVSLD